MTSPYGWRWLNSRNDLHTGVDIGAPEGTPIYAMLPGLCVVAAPSGQLDGYGNTVVLQHGPNVFSLYAHQQRIVALEGEQLAQGQQLGTVGRTAGTRADPGKVFASSGAHLHLEFLSRWPPQGRDLDRVDPAEVLAQLGVIVPQRGPLQLACGSSSSAQQVATSQDRPSSSPAAVQLTLQRAAAGGSGGLLLAAAAYWYWKKRRPR